MYPIFRKLDKDPWTKLYAKWYPNTTLFGVENVKVEVKEEVKEEGRRL